MRVESATTTMPQPAYNELLLQRDGNRYRWELFGESQPDLTALGYQRGIEAVRLGIDAVACRKIPVLTFLPYWKVRFTERWGVEQCGSRAVWKT